MNISNDSADSLKSVNRNLEGSSILYAREGGDEDIMLFRCDGVKNTGLGHVSRCVALAEALQEASIACRFVGKYEAGAQALLRSAGMSFEQVGEEVNHAGDPNRTLNALREDSVRGIVVDSYSANAAFLTTLHRAGKVVIVIDDFMRLERYDCSAILNFTVNAVRMKYVTQAIHLLGPRYLLVRRRIRNMRMSLCEKHGKKKGEVKNVLVAVGGEDLHDLSLQISKVLLTVAPGVTVHVVIGTTYSNKQELANVLSQFRCPGSFMVQLPDLAEEYAWADICFCGGGLTKYEAAYMGLPTAVISQNEEQLEETVFFASHGLAVDLGAAQVLDATSLASSLIHLIENKSQRLSLSEACLRTFPDDPTRNAAEAIVHIGSRTQ